MKSTIIFSDAMPHRPQNFSDVSEDYTAYIFRVEEFANQMTNKKHCLLHVGCLFDFIFHLDVSVKTSVNF
jgi:hypothetical protein